MLLDRGDGNQFDPRMMLGPSLRSVATTVARTAHGELSSGRPVTHRGNVRTWSLLVRPFIEVLPSLDWPVAKLMRNDRMTALTIIIMNEMAVPRAGATTTLLEIGRNGLGAMYIGLDSFTTMFENRGTEFKRWLQCGGSSVLPVALQAGAAGPPKGSYFELRVIRGDFEVIDANSGNWTRIQGLPAVARVRSLFAAHGAKVRAHIDSQLANNALLEAILHYLTNDTAVSFVMGYGMGGAQFVPKPGGGVFIYYLSDDYIRPYQGPTAAAPRPLNTNAHHRPANQEAADIAHTVARHLEGELDDLGAGVEAALADWRGGAYARPRLLNLEKEEVQRLDGQGSFFCSPLKDDMDLD